MIGPRSADQSVEERSINWLAQHKVPNTKLLYCNKLQTIACKKVNFTGKIFSLDFHTTYVSSGLQMFYK